MHPHMHWYTQKSLKNTESVIYKRNLQGQRKCVLRGWGGMRFLRPRKTAEQVCTIEFSAVVSGAILLATDCHHLGVQLFNYLKRHPCVLSSGS